MPPMDMPQQQPNNQMPPMDNNMGDVQGDEQFDSNFDAGVDANESNDPKTYIQQLAGKLSQSLRKYNEGLPNPDIDLNKYVAGMTNDAAVEGMTPEDVEGIISKIKSDETKTDGNQEEMPQMESKKVPNNRMTENINDVLSNTKNAVNDVKVTNNKSFKTKPYFSPNFK